MDNFIGSSSNNSNSTFVLITSEIKEKEERTQNVTTNEEVKEEKYTKQLEDGTKINTSEEFNSSKTYKNLEIGSVQYTSKNGMSVFLADVRNNGTTVHEK